MVFFLLPAVILCLIYFSALVLHLYRHRHRLRDAYANDFWDGAKYFLSTLWDGHGWIWHGYEVVGLENIPEKGLLIYYHGALPIDIYYLMAKYYLFKGKVIHAVGDRFLFKVPGLKLLFEVFKVTPGTVDHCVKALQSELLTIAPGGLYEAQFGNNLYNLMWKDRIGFAKVALKAKVPVIPVFTQNIRESFRAVSFFRNFFLKIHFKSRLPVLPVYGGFPVKLRTYIGEPILYDPTLTPEQLAMKTADSIQKLISKHQCVPGSIFRALLDRFR
ncbi:Transmembrane protein 68 [Nymphon striatum]|nr:Transmembrane protein 68 [Nymphon striatum]